MGRRRAREMGRGMGEGENGPCLVLLPNFISHGVQGVGFGWRILHG